MNSFTRFGILVVATFVLISDTFCDDSSEEDYVLHSGNCKGVGTKILITKPNGQSESCDCNQPPTVPAQYRPVRKFRPVKCETDKIPPKWACSSTFATTTTTPPTTGTGNTTETGNTPTVRMASTTRA